MPGGIDSRAEHNLRKLGTESSRKASKTVLIRAVHRDGVKTSFGLTSVLHSTGNGYRLRGDVRPQRRAVQWFCPLAAIAAWAAAGTARAWVYPEHRDIAVLAVETLDPERRT